VLVQNLALALEVFEEHLFFVVPPFTDGHLLSVNKLYWAAYYDRDVVCRVDHDAP
jgi:hypothetical protein